MTTKTKPTIEPHELAAVLHKATEQFVISREGRPKSDDSKPFIPATVWASQFSNCARQLTLRMTKGHELPAFPTESLARFRRGKDRAYNVKSDLGQAGRDSNPPFELIGQEYRFVLEWNGRAGTIEVISGKVDWKTKFEIPGLKPIPTEYKSWSPLLTDRINTFEDLFSNRWTRKGAYQLLCYMWGDNSELGLFVLDRPGIPKFLPVSLYANDNANLIRVQKFLELAYTAVESKVLDTLPDYIQDAEECKSCDFLGSHCTPPMLSSGAGLQFINNEELAVALARRAELQEDAKEFERLDDSIKKGLRGVEMGVCGDFLIEGKWGNHTKQVVPPEHQALAESWKKTDPKGKFTLKFFHIAKAADKEGQGED